MYMYSYRNCLYCINCCSVSADITVLAIIHIIYNMQKLPQVVSKLHNELTISVKKLTKVVVGKDETGMSQQVSCIHC